MSNVDAEPIDQSVATGLAEQHVPEAGDIAEHQAYAQGKDVIVSVQNVSRIFRAGSEEVRALRGVSLDVFSGEYLSIMGPSGSGKSTLFNMIGGLDAPTDGTVTIQGVQLKQLSRPEQARLRNRCIGYIFQSYNLIPVMTALQNVALPVLLGGATVEKANAKAAEMLDLVGLKERMHHRPEELSGGQQQRVAIARGFASEPVIILADEPTGNLDTKTGSDILDQLQRLCHDLGVTIISATHDHKMLSVSDRVVTIEDGQIRKIELASQLDIQVGSIDDGAAPAHAEQTPT